MAEGTRRLAVADEIGTTARRRAGRLAVLLAATLIGLAGCSSPSAAPPIASLVTGTSGGTGGHGSSTTSSLPGGGSTSSSRPTTPSTRGNATELLNGWAACMRSHGDPNQLDPTITPDKVIDITWNPAVPGGYEGTNKGGQGNSGPGQYCRQYLAAAQTALRGGPLQMPHYSTAQLERYSECMRANGIADFPDPSPDGGLVLSVGGDTDPSNPTFQHASRLCAQRTGVHTPTGSGTPPPGTIELNGGGPGINGG